MLTKEIISEYFYYKDGELIWKKGSPKTVGKIAGCVKGKGYKYVGFLGKHYRIHRLIYLLHYGYLPKILDHIDNNRLNNRIENLKEISNSENLKKAGVRRNSSSGVKGIIYRLDKWEVRNDGCSYGRYDSLFVAMMQAEILFLNFSERCDPILYNEYITWKYS